MSHRHLLPEEIDRLVDHDGGPGLADLVAHVDACSACRAQVEEARSLAELLDTLPHVKPALGFADRVLRQVDVSVPWYLEGWRTLSGLLPSPRVLRVAAVLAGGATMAAALAVGTAAMLRPDLADSAWRLGDAGITRGLDAAADAAAAVFGPGMRAAVREGRLDQMARALVAFAAAFAIAAAGLGLAASTARRRQEVA